MFVLRHPTTLWRGDRSVEVFNDRRRRIANLQRRSVDERLERRSRLPFGLCRTVEAALVEIAAPDHRAHVAVGWIHRNERTLQVLGQPCFARR
jgi:hypothetical protein